MEPPIIVEIRPEQVTPRLTALFDPQGPASLRCFGVLDGVENGKIFTDDPIRPQWGMVWEATDGTLYPGGVLNASTILHAVETLRLESDVLVGFMDGDILATLLPQAPDYTDTVLEFLDRPVDTSDLDGLVRGLLPGFTLQRMTPALLEHSLTFDVHHSSSPEALLSKHLPVCLIYGSTIVCEASASPSIRGMRELGVVTREQYRGQGFATSTCAYLIQRCAEAGDRTYWNCASSNVASAAVARKLGYRTEREYRLLAWFKSPT